MVKIISQEEHDEYEHLCGRTGRQVDEDKPCGECDQYYECLMDHVIAETFPEGATIEEINMLYPISARMLYEIHLRERRVGDS